jgi:WD40 repeat protein
MIAGCSADGTVQARDLAAGTPVAFPFTQGRTVNAVAVAELDGRPVVISGGGDKTVRAWDPATGALAGGPVHRPGKRVTS